MYNKPLLRVPWLWYCTEVMESFAQFSALPQIHFMTPIKSVHFTSSFTKEIEKFSSHQEIVR